MGSNEIPTMAEEMAQMDEQEYKGHKIGDLRKVMTAVENKEHWKNPWAAAVPHEIVPIVFAAVEFFHADTPRIVGIQRLTGKVLMEGSGYQAW